MTLIPIIQLILHSNLDRQTIQSKLENEIEENIKVLASLRTVKKYTGKIICPYFLMRRITGIKRYENLTFAQGKVIETKNGCNIHLKLQMDMISTIIIISALIVAILSLLTTLISFILSATKSTFQFNAALPCYLGLFSGAIYGASFAHFYIEAMTIKVFLQDILQADCIE